MSDTLHHITLNTGHVAETPRGDVRDGVIRVLRPIIEAGGGAIPGLDGWRLDFWFPRGTDGGRCRGAACFQIADAPDASASPAVMGVTCMRQDLSADAWAQARSCYTALEEPLRALGLWRDMPPEPPAPPWLAVWLTPFAALVPPTLLPVFGDLERCVAWTLADEAVSPNEGGAAESELLRLVATTPLRELMPSIWYPGYMPGMPDILAFRTPPALRSNRDPARPLNDEIKLVFVETPGDHRAVEEALAAPLAIRGGRVDFRVTIDRPNARRSTFPSGRDFKVLLFVPCEEGWPHLIVTMLPRNTPDLGMARERYGWDAFATEADAQEHLSAMARDVRRRSGGGLALDIVSPDTGSRS